MIAIIGAGLTGLSTARYLKKKPHCVFEQPPVGWVEDTKPNSYWLEKLMVLETNFDAVALGFTLLNPTYALFLRRFYWRFCP